MTNRYKVLYYPHFQPNSKWLLSMLLLTDQIDRIVPEDAVPNDPDLIKELIQEIPGGFVSKSPTTEDIEFDRLTLQRLKQAFRYIREQSFGEKNPQIQIRVGRGGALEIDGHVFLHHGKVAPRVRELLIEEGMLSPFLEEVVKNTGEENYHPVPERASNLILSCIADRIARHEGLDTVTDEELGFVATTMDSCRVAIGNPQGSVEGALLSAVAKVAIPQEIEILSIRSYKDLRESYSGIREAFKEYVTNISALNRLGRIEDSDVLSERILDIADKLKRECDAYTKSNYARQFKAWAPFAVCSMLSIGAAIVDPSFGLTFAAGTVSLELLKKVFIEDRRKVGTPEACRLLGGMRKEIIKRATIEALV